MKPMRQAHTKACEWGGVLSLEADGNPGENLDV